MRAGKEIGEDGIEDAFEVLQEISARVQTATWVGDCLIYTGAAWHLNYVVGGEVTTLFHLDHPTYLVGYLRTPNRLILVDKDFSVLSYKFLLSIIEYKTLVIRGDLEETAKALESIPKESHNSMAEFLEAKGYVEEALANCVAFFVLVLHGRTTKGEARSGPSWSSRTSSSQTCRL